LLDSLHPARCPALPAPLLERARASALGRRHIVRAALHAAPAVFAPDQGRWRTWEDQEPWLRWTCAELEAFTRELGALAFGPALRIAVERSEVLFLREALGLEVWRRAQSADIWGGPAPEAVRHMGRAVMQRCGRDAAALRAAVFERGEIEFLAHAGRRDPRLAERLALAYATAPVLPCIKECWLPAAAVPAVLAAQAVPAAAEEPAQDDGIARLEVLPE
jgi:hypothetical protein